MLSVEQARQQMLDTIGVLPTEQREILECSDYVLAEDLYASENIPPFDNSAMDGFAVLSSDVKDASKENPTVLSVVETIAAGFAPEKQVSSGSAARIMTGAMMPDGADAVVMQEVTEFDGDTVKVFESVAKSGNVRFTGESVKVKDCVMSNGKPLRPPEISMMASLNCASVAVYRKPVVAIVSTGDELTPIGEALKPGKIRDSNRYGLYAQVQNAGGIPIDMGIAPDDEDETERIFLKSLSQADALITSGGVSVGEHDVVRNVLTKLGQMHFWRVAMKPGKPQVYGFIDDKPIFGLPGNPVSSLVVFELFVRPALLKMAGHTELLRPTFEAVLTTDVTNSDGRVNYMRAIISKENGEYVAKTTGPQGSGILHSLVLANGLITIPSGVTLSAGKRVEAQFLN
ncbi:molybdopterin molybdotransferase MoeA [Candidatus Poribacteria bacterium]|nr:molybdopterin molybdotransferase MoeA [Candidatus Poribacteria bacterium]MYB63739.1 molybdopterin molybdotransferase MoeA [Candidatus Poribacteria bacterium]MYF56147.1 molybdopterin molybdotransferase MoeA [Candidatus Poribacteria bacterium]MYI93555.1 molybdopterin molybdotransferase MoeA [Candidatus Poribacteria bacterium]